MKNIGGTTTELRLANRNKIYKLIHESRQISKQELARSLMLSLPTINQNIKELQDMGLIDQVGTFESTGGRKAKAISMVSDAKISIGIELTLHHVRIAAVDLEGNCIQYVKISQPFVQSSDYAYILSDCLEGFITGENYDRDKILGVGVAIPGIINDDKTVVNYAPTMHIREMPVSDIIGQMPYVCNVVNDANAGGFAEVWQNPNGNTMAYLSLGQGVGGALMINNKIYNGLNNRGAEFGHITLVKGGRRCSCGQLGCLERYCSTTSLSDDLGCQLEEFFDGLEQGNVQYLEIWEEYQEYLCMGINNIRMVLDCDVILGGTLSNYLEKYIPAIRDRLKQLNSFEDNGNYLRLCRYSSRGCAIGAALQFVDQFIKQI